MFHIKITKKMRKILIFTLATMFSLSACTQDDENPIKEKYNVDFQASTFSQVESDLKSGLVLTETIDKLHLFIVRKSDGEIVEEIKQDKADDGFGSFSVEVEQGTYEFVFAGVNYFGNTENNDAGKLTLITNSDPDLRCLYSIHNAVIYVYNKDITVSEDQDLSVVLENKTSKIVLAVTDKDEAPEDYLSAYYLVNKYKSFCYNTDTVGEVVYGVHNVNRVLSYTSHPFYTLEVDGTYSFANAEPMAMSIDFDFWNVTKYDHSNGRLLYTKQVNYTMTRGKVINISGTMFNKVTNSVNFDISIDEDWTGEDTQTFN
jgi:hypothetical protein